MQSSGLCVTGILNMLIQTLMCLWSPFIMFWKHIYYMERKPNKRVGDLINVLLTYKEDNCWWHKREKIYATKHQSANNNLRHTRGMFTADEDLMIVKETTWFYSKLSLISDIWKYKVERKSPFQNLRIKPGRLPPIWLSVLLQANIGFRYFKIAGRKSSLPKIL